MRQINPTLAAARRSDDPQQQDLRVVAAWNGVVTTVPYGWLPLIRQRRRSGRPARILTWTTRGGWTAAHHTIYSKEQRYVAASPQATPVISLDPLSRRYGSSRT
jgi:hypothetical protein